MQTLNKFYKNFFLNGRFYLKRNSVEHLVEEDKDSMTIKYENFAEGLMQDFPINKYKNVLEVACSNNFILSRFLAKRGYKVTAMDNRLSEKLAENDDGISYLKKRFVCDDVAGKENGTSITNFDYITAVSPCNATEHVIRQCLNYDKPFNMLLCDCNNRSIFGEKFDSHFDWYEYLSKISSEVKIIFEKGYYFATNLEKINSQFFEERIIQYDFCE